MASAVLPSHKTSTLFAVRGYNPVVESNVCMIRDTDWIIGKDLIEEFNEIDSMILHGEGFTMQATKRLASSLDAKKDLSAKMSWVKQITLRPATTGQI